MTNTAPIQGMSSDSATKNPIQPVQRGRAAYRTMARDEPKVKAIIGGANTNE